MEEQLVEKKTKTTYSKVKVKYSQSQVKEGAEWGKIFLISSNSI